VCVCVFNDPHTLPTGTRITCTSSMRTETPGSSSSHHRHIRWHQRLSDWENSGLNIAGLRGWWSLSNPL